MWKGNPAAAAGLYTLLDCPFDASTWKAFGGNCHRLLCGVRIKLSILSIFSFTLLHLPLDVIHVCVSSLRPKYLHSFGRPFTNSRFRWVSRLGFGSGTRRWGPRGGSIWCQNTCTLLYALTSILFRWWLQFPHCRPTPAELQWAVPMHAVWQVNLH